MKSYSDLHRFCQHVVDKYGSPEQASEDDKAGEFRAFYLPGRQINLKTLKSVASACGIRLNGLEEKGLPANLRGYHDVYNGNKNIYYRRGDSLSGIENTILHEFREMIEPVFAEVCPDYEPLRTLAVHMAANRFASSVLLPRESFAAKVYHSGLDVIALSSFYHKSCAQVLLRMGEVLRGKLCFYAALYEHSKETDGWSVAYWTGSRNEECPEANVSGLFGFIPKKGHPPQDDSLVDRVIKTGKPHMVRHITLIDEVEDDGLTAIAQPLLMDGALSKVPLMVLLESESDKLNPQVKRIKPVIIEEFYKHL